MNIAVIGDGGWGTCLSLLAQQAGRVTVWGAFADYVDRVRRQRENTKYLPGVRIPRSIRFTADLAEAVRDADLTIVAVPSVHLRAVLRRLRPLLPARCDILSAVKGIEPTTHLRMSEVIRQELGSRPRIAVLSGPNIAAEVARRVPAAAVCASAHAQVARKTQHVLMRPWFRVYTHGDVTGVEVGGALKNVIAIACGIADGLGFGTNTKAALITRGLVEMTRFGVAAGAQARTFYGLSGIGDLVTTAMSGKSRNRWLGEQLAQGRQLSGILASTEMAIEGVATTRAVASRATECSLEMPITREVYRVLFRRKKAAAAVAALMRRTRKNEQ